MYDFPVLFYVICISHLVSLIFLLVSITLDYCTIKEKYTFPIYFGYALRISLTIFHVVYMLDNCISMIGYLEHYSYTSLLNKRVYSITATCISANITSLFVFAVFFYSWYSVSIVLKNSNSFSKRLSPKIQQVNQRVFPIFIIAFSLISIIFQTSNYFINKDKPLWLSIFRNFYGDAVSLCVAILLMPLLCDLIKAILMVNQIRKKQVHDEHSLTDQDPTLLMVRMTIICFLAILYHLFDAIFDLISPTALFALTGNLYHAALLEVRNPATPLLLILSTNGFFASMLYITKYMPKRLSKMKSVPKSRKTIEVHDN